MSREIAPHVLAAHEAACRRSTNIEIPGYLIWRSDVLLWQFVPNLEFSSEIAELDKLASSDRLQHATLTLKPETI
jgi:hypothetical protein